MRTQKSNTNFLFSLPVLKKSHGFKLRFQSLRETRNVVEKKISTKEDNSAKILVVGLGWLVESESVMAVGEADHFYIHTLVPTAF